MPRRRIGKFGPFRLVRWATYPPGPFDVDRKTVWIALKLETCDHIVRRRAFVLGSFAVAAAPRGVYCDTCKRESDYAQRQRIEAAKETTSHA